LFSKIQNNKKLFKEINWPRLQEQLSDISVSNIEQCRTNKIDIEKIVTNFSIMKAKRMKF